MADLRIKWDPPIRTDIVDSISIYRYPGALSSCQELSSSGVEIASGLTVDTVSYDDLGTPDFEVVTYGVYSVNSGGLSLCSFLTKELMPTLLSAPSGLESSVYDLEAENAPTELQTGEATLKEQDAPTSIGARVIYDEATANTFYWMQVNGKYIAPLFRDENQARNAQVNGGALDPVRLSFQVPDQITYETWYKPRDVGGTDLAFGDWDSDVFRNVMAIGSPGVTWVSEYAESYLSQSILDEAKEAPTNLRLYNGFNPLEQDLSIPGLFDNSPFPKDLVTDEVPDDQLARLLESGVTFNPTFYRWNSDTIPDHTGNIVPDTSNFSAYYGDGYHYTDYIDTSRKLVWVKWIGGDNRYWKQGKVYLREIKNGAIQFWPHDRYGQAHNFPQQASSFEFRDYAREPSNYQLRNINNTSQFGTYSSVMEEGKYNKVTLPDEDDPQLSLKINDWGINWVVCKQDGREDLGKSVYSGWVTEGSPVAETRAMADSRIPYMTDYSDGTNPEFQVGQYSRPSYGPWRDRLGVYVLYTCSGVGGIDNPGTCRSNLWNRDYINQYSFSQSAFNAPTGLTAETEVSTQTPEVGPDALDAEELLTVGPGSITAEESAEFTNSDIGREIVFSDLTNLGGFNLTIGTLYTTTQINNEGSRIGINDNDGAFVWVDDSTRAYGRQRGVHWSFYVVSSFDDGSGRAEFLATDTGRYIIGMGGGESRGLVNGVVFTIYAIHTNTLHADITNVGGGAVTGSGVIRYSHLGTQWEFYDPSLHT